LRGAGAAGKGGKLLGDSALATLRAGQSLGSLPETLQDLESLSTAFAQVFI
jgi:hypothetical protein